MRSRSRRSGIALAALALTLAACSGADVAEKIIESQEGVGDIDIEENNGTVSIEIEVEEGSVSGVLGGGEMPDDFPVPVPDGGTVMAVITQAGNNSVSLSYPQSEFDSVKSFYASYVKGKKVLVETNTQDPPASGWVVEEQGMTIQITVADNGSTTDLAILVVDSSG